MLKITAALLAAAMTMQFAAPVMARDFFDSNTMLGWRQQTGAAVVAYVRAPIGPPTFKTQVRSGLAITGPRYYKAGESALHSTGPHLVDLSFTKGGINTRWVAQFSVGNKLAWTNERPAVDANTANVATGMMAPVAVSGIAAGLAAGTVGFVEGQ
jgi:hypothetical protein